MSVLSGNITDTSPEDSFIRKVLMTIPEQVARHTLLTIYLQEQIGHALHLPPSLLDSQRPLSTLGIDSLGAIELKNEIETRLGVTLPLIDFLGENNISQLASQILAELALSPLIPIEPSPMFQERMDRYSLSYGQRAIWFLHQLAPESAAYNVASAVRIQAELDIPALQRACQSLVDRHPSLRTTFAAPLGEPIQHIHPQFEVSFQVVDASTWSETFLYERLVEEAHHPFDLEKSSILRLNLFIQSPQEQVFLLTAHHIGIDLWSLAVLAHTLGKLYQAEKSGVSAALPPLTWQYTDYARWQADMLAGQKGEQLWQYWQKQLGGELPILNLPTDRPRPTSQTYQGDSELLRLNADLTKKLKALSRTYEVTLYTTLLAAFQVLLYRYTGQEDILVGSPTAGRNRAELADLVGYFVNPIVLRANLSGNPTFVVFLHQVRQTMLSAFEHQEYPFAQLVERLQPVRDSSRSPLFQAMFVLQKAPRFIEALAAFALGETGAYINLNGLELTSLAIERRVAQFDLTLAMAEVDNELVASFQYNTDLFEATTIAKMARHLQKLLDGITADPTQRLSDIPMLSDAERRQVLVEWNDTGASYSAHICLHELFEAQVARTPDAVALVFGNHCLTYEQLNRQANQLASYLREVGVEPEVLVGVCLERSVEMVVALLGILKAGGAYVPLDPAYPQQRLTFILQDTKSPVILTQQSFREQFLQYTTCLVCLDTEGDPISQESDQNFPDRAVAENVAYIIYTSGSTGSPKGVAIAHQNAVALVEWAKGVFDPQDLAGVLASTSICFDLSVFEIFTPLSCGGAIILAETALHLPSLPAAQAVTLVNTVPSVMVELVSLKAIPLSVRVINLAGEPLNRQLVQQLYQLETVKKVFDLYGPSEDTTYSTYALREAEGPATIGRPITNTNVYLLDAHLNPVPIGVLGEVYIGGAGLARGYYRRPDLTAEQFIPDPFSSKTGARLYRTGDLGRYLPDGNLEFRGRLDHQVKIRGFRIELGEIEATLRQHPAVQEAVVVVSPTAYRDKQLAAYLVPLSGNNLTPEMLRSFLREKLPAYMIPTVFMMLEVLPVTPSGKVDRQALPMPDQISSEPEGTGVPPRTPAEEILVGIWKQVLGIERVGTRDNFFELGGHSLLATQVISRIRDAFGFELPLRALFETPTIAELAKRLTETRRLELGSSAPPLLPATRDEEIPLSFAQQRLWFLHQLTPTSAAYNMPMAVRLTGALDRTVLEQSFNQLIQRHEALRTTFTVVDGRPVQSIAPVLTISLPLLDLRDLPETEREAKAWQWLKEEAMRPFDLTRESLIRASLLLLATGENSEGESSPPQDQFHLPSTPEHILFLNLHHIVADGWSLGILVRELMAFYRAGVVGEISPLPKLPLQYADFALWQRGWLQGEALEAQLSYWQERLGGAPSVLDLPTDRPRPTVQTEQGATQTFTLSASLSAALHRLSLQEGATLFMTLLAAFDVLLYRYTSQTDISIGSPIANRQWSEIEGLIGCFVNTLVLRTRLSGNPTFREILRQVREATLDAYAHQDIPFELLVEKLQRGRDLSHTPLFQVMFVLQNTPMDEFDLSGVGLRLLEIDSQTTKFDLTLTMVDTGTGLTGLVTFNVDLFNENTIAQLVDHFQILLEGIVADPNLHLTDMPILTEGERQQIIKWNSTQTGYPYDRCLHELFETQVERTPEAVAVVAENGYLTYAKLNSRANQLAHYLQKLGVGPEVKVGVCLERSLEMVVGLLGVLKAGGAYVPLDPTYPAERLAFMLADAQVAALLTQQEMLAHLPKQSNCLSIVMDTDRATLAQESEDNLVSRVIPGNLAYVIYTSGSTGQPKGVLINHQNVVHSTTARLNYYQEPVSNFLLTSPFAFDSSVAGIFWTLSHGGSLVLPHENFQRDPAALAQLITQQQISHVLSLPSFYRLLLDQFKRRQLTAIKTVIVAGESCPGDLLDSHLAYFPQVAFFNEYGPTEATVWSTVYYGQTQPLNTQIPIGRPIANAQIYILDAQLQLVPPGLPGELYIGGLGLSRGYLGRADLTAERFIPNPFNQEVGTRLYRTGDMGRYRSDGNIEFLGRMDHQVKIRGFRIELGEIEAVLAQHPAVREAAVVIRGDEVDNRRLVVYGVANDGLELKISDLRHFLSEKLPEYMLPAVFVILKAMPLTPHGKVDRRALPAPDNFYRELETEYIAPQTKTEQIIAQSWRHALQVEKVGLHDNFFELGGHSLLATQVISRLRSSFQVELPLRTLFEAPTIAELAQWIEEKQYSVHQSSTPTIAPITRTNNLPASFAQQRLWFLDQLATSSPIYNIPAAIRLTGALSIAALEQSLNEVVRRHETLRTTFVMADGQVVQRIAASLMIKLSVVDLQYLAEMEREDQIRQLAVEEAQRPFNLERGPLIRSIMLQLGERAYVLLLTMHHIISDGWSKGVLIREIAALYQAFSAGQPSPLPELPIQYTDFAVWQRQHLQGEVIETQLSYWQQQLAGSRFSLELLADHFQPKLRTFQGATIWFNLPKKLSIALSNLSYQAGVTLFMTLLAAFQTLLYRYTRQTDIVVGSPIANRTLRETEELIGFFVNTLILRTDLSGNLRFWDLLGRVRQVCLDAYAHQDLPFEQLVEAIQPERETSHSPLFQVMFALQNTPTSAINLSDLILQPIQIDSGTAKRELTLVLTEEAEGLSGFVTYSTTLFEPATIKRIVKNFQTLLENIVTHPYQRLNDLEMLTEAEKEEQILTKQKREQANLHKFMSIKPKAIKKAQ